MLTRISRQAAELVEKNLLVDRITISTPRQTVSKRYEESIQLETKLTNIPALVQKIPRQGGVSVSGSISQEDYSIKVGVNTPLSQGEYVTVTKCLLDSTLEGHTLLVDQTSHNGIGIVRRGVASSFVTVDGQNKTSLEIL